MDPTGEGESEWKRVVAGRAQRIVSTTLRRVITNDFDTDADSAAFTNTSGTVTYDTGLSGGVVRLKGGILALAFAGVANAGGAALVGNPTTQPWYAHARAWIKHVPAGTSFFAPIAFQDTGNLGEIVKIGYDASSADLYLQIIGPGGATTTLPTGVAADLTGFRDYGIGRDPVRDKLFAVLDDDVILEADGPFANLTVLPSYFSSSLQTTLLGQDIEMWVDEIATAVERT